MIHQLEAIQRASFPMLSEDEIITAAHYAAQIERFPEGQWAVVTPEGRVVACATDLRSRVDLDHIEHRYIDAVGHNWLTTHDPDGDWLYGADIGVLPAYRRRGLGRLLYEARHDLVRRLNLRGHVAGGMLKGYGEYRHRMPVEEYVSRVVAGELFDPTLSVQLHCGFRVHGIIQNYVTDASCDNKAALIIWRNPKYRE
jgi:GNAT superfamily N-acetyltransferase